MDTRRELLDAILDFMGEAGDADARTTAEILLNRVIQTIWLKKDWADHRMPTPYTFSSVVGQRAYVLPDHFGRVAGFERAIQNLTNGLPVHPITADDLTSLDPEAGTSLETPGSPRQYVLGGTQGVLVQPAATGEALEVLSSSAADTAVRVTVEGENSDGVWTATEVTLVGEAPVAVGTFRTVINFSKAYAEGTDPASDGASSAGTVTLRTVAASAVLETLRPLESAHERLTLTLYPVPDAVYQFAVPMIRAPRALNRGSDSLPRFWGPAVFEECRLEWSHNQGVISLMTFITAPRPRLTELIQHDNATLYRGMSVQPYAG